MSWSLHCCSEVNKSQCPEVKQATMSWSQTSQHVLKSNKLPCPKVKQALCLKSNSRACPIFMSPKSYADCHLTHSLTQRQDIHGPYQYNTQLHNTVPGSLVSWLPLRLFTSPAAWQPLEQGLWIAGDMDSQGPAQTQGSPGQLQLPPQWLGPYIILGSSKSQKQPQERGTPCIAPTKTVIWIPFLKSGC